MFNKNSKENFENLLRFAKYFEKQVQNFLFLLFKVKMKSKIFLLFYNSINKSIWSTNLTRLKCK